ncbi:alpha/beta hydrolase family protein [Bifidobacterium choloepi]|uniref:Alpha/beta hydrolase n=1 Tax=Bifidobacterium choloepi TaxID=2614131 RepID=A0A6I5N4K7_9BIFI|nr:alpha/beta hydrolase [Bifidobacterium choloepi]NEG70609.1 alpha/beta hydrolase [Bifidobacterium choloepi]
MVGLPIFIILMAILISVSANTRTAWNYEPTGQTMETLSANTAVTFDTTGGDELGTKGEYQVEQHYEVLHAVEPSTGDVQDINVLIREPVGAGNNLPGIVFMHGAGYGTCDNSFGDMAYDMASAGFVTAVLDKPVWSTNDATRDYPGSATAYDEVIDMLRDMDNVDDSDVGIYATSESTWIASYLLEQDPDIAFQVLLSPMVFSPRVALGFLAAQDFALVGAHDGYQSIVRRIFSLDTAMFGLTNIDLDTLNPTAYSVPTLVAYGSKDVMTAQVQGAKEILKNAHEAGNYDVTIRSYPVANHVLRLGDEANEGTPFADDYVNDVISWIGGTTKGLTQTSPKIAGTNLYQSIAVPTDLSSHPAMTVVLVVILALMVLTLVAAIVVWLVALVWMIVNRCRRRGSPLGYRNGFGKALFTLSVITMAAFVLFCAGLGDVIMGVVKLAWGDAPTDSPGVMYWSWPVIQVACVLVVWAWSLTFSRMIEAASMRGLVQWPVRKGAVEEIVTGRRPVLATRRFGRVVFWITVAAMFMILLFFAFWGLFVY